VQTRAPKIFTGEETGTRLVITQLREKEWSRGEVRRMLRQVTSISSPFSTGVDNFAVTLEVPDHPEWLQGIPDIPTLLNRAPWHFEFTFNNGRFEWKYEFRGIPKVKVEPRTKKRTAKNSEPLQLPLSSDTDEFGNEQGARKARPRSVIATKETGFGLGAIHGEFYVFDRDRDILLNLGDVAFVKNVLDENGGVRIYRDGIRVYNFGESGDDWLGLDLRRVNSPTKRVSRNIILGAIELSLKDTCKSLTEKTNREGFIENDAYRRLRQVVLGALSVMEIERDEDKNRIRIMTMKGSDHEVERIQKPLDELRAAAKAHKVDVVLAPYIKKIEKDYTEFRETMLRAGLSGLGLAVVFHEVERGVRVLYESIDRGQKIEALKKQAQGLVRVLDGFSELLRKGDARKQSLKHLLQSARDINSVRLRTHGIRLVCPALDDPTPDQGVVFAFNLALGALNNLIDNAIHWLKVRWPDVDGKQSTRSIYLDINLKDFPEGPAIVVADNGPGFQDDPEHLIRPFFSRRPDGMGLGLYYTNLVMELSHGILVFPDPNDLGVPEIFDGAAIAMVFPGEKT
jgi:signal transduction histidine kinase